MNSIRHYQHSDYPMMRAWWASYSSGIPTEDMLPEESTFVASRDGQPMAAISVYLNNIKEAAYLENFVANPEYPHEARAELVEALLAYAESFARRRGYKKLMCLAHHPKLVERYTQLGYTPTLTGLTGLIKEL